MNDTLILILIGIWAFLLGGLLVYGVIGYRINTLLKEERSAFNKLKNHKRGLSFADFYFLIAVLKKHKDHYKQEVGNLVTIIEQERLNIASLSQKNNELKERLTDKDRENYKLKRNNQGSHLKDRTENDVKPIPLVIKKQPDINHPARKTIIYFGIPDRDGNFVPESGSSTQDDKKLYRIVTESEGEVGGLYYISGPLDLKAIDNIDFYLIPVCEVENIPDRSFATKVIQKEAGRVVLVSGKWVCDKKIKIKLI